MTELQIDDQAALAQHRSIILGGESGKHPDHVQHLRRAWHAAGFTPITVKTRSKKPLATEWQREHEKDQPEAITGAAKAFAMSTGILCKGLRVIDVDVSDAIVALTVERLAAKHFSETPLRRGRDASSRCALFYRAAEGAPGWRFIESLNGEDLIEVRGDRQQVVVDGLHQDTGLPYRISKLPFYDFKFSDLPAITEDQIATFLNEAAAYIGAAPETARKSKAKSRADAGPFDELPVRLQRETIKAALGFIDNSESDSYFQWRDAIWSCKDAEQRGCIGALDEAQEWARRGAQYNGEESDAAFERTADGFRQGGVGIGSLLRAARLAGGGHALKGIAGPAIFDDIRPASDATSDAKATPRDSDDGRELEWICGADRPPELIATIIEDLIESSAVSIIYGPSGLGKTTLVVDMACHLAHGMKWHGRKVMHGAVVFIELEGKAGLRARIQAWHQHNGVKYGSVPLWTSTTSLALDQPGQVASVIGLIRRTAAETSLPVQWLIVDTLARSKGNLKEDDASDMGKIISAAQEIIDATSVAVTIIGHPGKDMARGLRGSYTLSCDVNTVIEFDKAGNGAAELVVVKQKNSEGGSAGFFNIEKVLLGQSPEGKDITGAVAVQANAPPPTAPKSKTGSAKDAARIAIFDSAAGGRIDFEAAFAVFNSEFSGKSKVQESRRRAFRREIDALKEDRKIRFDGESIFIGAAGVEGVFPATASAGETIN